MTSGIGEKEVLGALSGVRDPELDEPITDLGFVSGFKVEGDSVDVRLRLPTYWCSPNFAYIMVADAREAVLALRGVARARISLDDHHASGEINASVEEGTGFDGAFGDEASGRGLDEVRELFRRKAFVRRGEMLCRSLLSGGHTPVELARITLGDLPPSPEAEAYLERRGELGLDVFAGAPFLVDPDGKKVPEEAVVKHLKYARLVRASVEGNGEFCRGLLASRYGTMHEQQEATA